MQVKILKVFGLSSLGFLFGALTALAAPAVEVPDNGMILVLPSDSSTYTLLSGSSFENVDVNNASFTFTIADGETVKLSSNNSNRTLTNSLATTVCGSGTSQVTMANTSGFTKIVDVTPGDACSVTTTTTTSSGTRPSSGGGGSSGARGYYGNAVANSAQNNVIVNAGGPAIVLKKSLGVGATGNDVKGLQSFLNSHGFIITTTGEGSPGKEGNAFGKLTKAAVMKFQKAYGIEATGFVGPLTRAMIAKIQSLKH